MQKWRRCPAAVQHAIITTQADRFSLARIAIFKIEKETILANLISKRLTIDSVLHAIANGAIKTVAFHAMP
jgi:hypothetical protein